MIPLFALEAAADAALAMLTPALYAPAAIWLAAWIACRIALAHD